MVRIAATAIVLIVLAAALPALGAPETPNAQQGHLVLRVGGQAEMGTRNVLAPRASDRWTENVLDRVYGSVVLPHPKRDGPMAWIAKGTDVNEDGIFEAAEYDAWRQRDGAATPLDVTVYYDFNSVRWHDGTQVTVWDLLFAYHVGAMHPRLNTSSRALLCDPRATYDLCNRWLGVSITAKNWEGEDTLPGDPSLRVAVRFILNEPFVRFYNDTLAPLLLPMHVWSLTGGGRHPDFGCAIWIPPAEAVAKGIQSCGNPNPATWGVGVRRDDVVPNSKPYEVDAVIAWSPKDADVIGHGPFAFVRWFPGVEVAVSRNEAFYRGEDPADPSVVYDDRLARALAKPTIAEIRFILYRTAHLAVFALKSGEVDFFLWRIPAEYVPDLLLFYDIAAEANSEPGFPYLAYNFRRGPWGYRDGNASDDAGRWFRQAASYLVDRRTMGLQLFQNFVIITPSIISPSNTFWHKDLPLRPFDPVRARTVLDSPEARTAGIGPDPPGDCRGDAPSGCRSLGSRGTRAFSILTPHADFDGAHAAMGAMIASAMRDVGLNAVATPTAYPEILVNASTGAFRRDFDLLISNWRLEDDDPDFLFRMFHTSAGSVGDNHPGVSNATLDGELEAARRALDRSVRRQHVFRIQELLDDLRPYEVLNRPTNIEAYRQGRFVNWTVSAGTIWNFWSLQGIRGPILSLLQVTLLADSGVASGGMAIVAATVFDHERLPLEGATVRFAVSLGTVDPETRVTNEGGRATATFLAPFVTAETTVVLRATATHRDYPDPQAAEAVIRVFPVGVRFLVVAVDLPAGDLLIPGGELPLSVTVRDQIRLPVADARVNVSTSDPSRVAAAPSSGTSADLRQVRLRAIGTVSVDAAIRTTVAASKAGYADGETTFAIILRAAEEPPPRPPPPSIPSEDARVWVIVAALDVAAVALLWQALRLGKKRSPPGGIPPESRGMD